MAKSAKSCGAKGGFVQPPDFLFRASCTKHDELYARGKTKADRKKADDKFFELMLEDTERSEGFDRYYFKVWAYVYYKAVRIFGSKHFNYID